ncbi:MAG: FIST C-terminal domain-containing protein, partial [Polyangiaceae bacterium]|nr:FIST C-terminal domain-containing protein [Polyangiaceae bacterium]
MIEIAHTDATDARAAAADLRSQIHSTPRFVAFFASARYEASAIAAAVHEAFGGIPTMGGSSSGELVSGKMTKGAISLIALGEETVESCSVAVIEDAHDEASIDRALAALAEPFEAAIGRLDPQSHLGLVLHDGMSAAEESVMERIGDRTNLAFVGGSAGDDLRFEKSFVFANGRAFAGASVLALLRMKRPFRILKTQSFEVLDTILRVTEVDESTRTVKRFDDKPAAEAYAAAIGVSVSELPAHFREYPLGLVTAEGDPFVRSPQQCKGTDVVFYCRVSEGMELHVLRSRDIVDDTRRDVRAAIEALGACRGILNFHCILRTLELEDRGQCEAYAAIFADVPTAGLSTYGESYVGHINQTST